jgi:DNA replication protein DnaC
MLALREQRLAEQWMTDSERQLNVKTEQCVSVPSGMGKTHLLIGLAVAACRQKRRVRFATAAELINEMVEAKHQLQLGRALARWARYDLIALDEVGYVPLAEIGAEFLFQVIAERAEKAAVIVTTKPAILGMDSGDFQCPALQGAARPNH